MRLLFLVFVVTMSMLASVQADDLVDGLLDVDFDFDEVDDGASAEERLLRGNYYYHYLTSDYHEGLAALAAWKDLRETDESPEQEAEVMRAAMLLALGLEDEAEKAFFNAGITTTTASGDSWYYLAKRWYDLGEWERAEISARNALQADPKITQSNLQETYSILVSSLSLQSRISDARVVLRSMADESIWTGIARYNLILVMIRQNFGSRDLERLIADSIFYLPKNKEGNALRDRILLVAGISAMDNGKPEMANDYFQKMSLESVFSAPGLLHYGWNLLGQWRYEDALQPWRILQQQYDGFQPAVIESFLAVPHTLELIEATNESVQAYTSAEAKIVNMLEALDSFRDPVQIHEWILHWQLDNQSEGWGWQRQRLADVPDTPVALFAQGLIDEPAFVERLARLHDLDRMEHDLQRQKHDLELWQDVLVVRQQTLQNMGGKERLAALERQHMDLLRRTLAVQDRLMAEDEAVFAYASESEHKNIDLLRNVVPNVSYLSKVGTPTRDLAPYKERWRRMRGIQLWNIYEQEPQRRWDTTRHHWKLRAVTEQLLVQVENTRTSLEWADSSWKGFPERVTRLQQSLNIQLAQVEELHQRQLDDLQTMTDEYLTTLRARLNEYLAQSRLAIARLYDDSLQRKMRSAGGDK
ncbi:MAG: hypothetical protein VB954_05485 [Thalassolituus sp.]|uniref:hypothetical protein n=1 Tax=Thalassolituus TaxID=187492 RepID=UPI0030C88840